MMSFATPLSLAGLVLSLVWVIPGCGGDALDAGATGGASGPQQAPAAQSGETFTEALRGNVYGKPLDAKSLDLQPSNGQWFLNIRSYANDCGVMSTRPDPESSVIVTIGGVQPQAGDQAIVYGDAHAATFQLGVYDATGPKPQTTSASGGLLRLDRWDATPGAEVTGALRLEGGTNEISGTFKARVCASR